MLRSLKAYVIGTSLITLLIVVLILARLASRDVDARDPRVRELSGVLTVDGRPWNGQVTERYPDGHVYRVTNYVDGLRDGVQKEYALNNTLHTLSRYSAGKKHGFQEGWYAEGPKRFEANYREGLLEGLQTEWHLNGKIFRQIFFEAGNEVSRKILFPTAEVYSNYVVREGRRFGLDGGALCFETKKDGEK